MNTATKAAITLAAGLAVGGGLYGYSKLDEYWVTHHSSGEVMNVVSLDDGAMLASEKIERQTRRRDRSTDQIEYTDEVYYRLRRYDQKSGNDQARRLVDGLATCVAAGQGRAWCTWEQGHAYLLDAKLETIGEADHMPGEEELAAAAAAAPGAKAPPPPPHMTILPVARANGGSFAISMVGPDPRQPVHFNGKKGSKTLQPRRTYIAQGFLVDGDQNALPVKGAVFLVYRTTATPDARHKLTRLSYNGVPAWTADLPEPPDSARLDGETVVLVGRTRSVAIAVADGKERWSTPHGP
jgi:hypothetical protein